MAPKAKKPAPRRIVLVRWHDAVHQMGWLDDEDRDKEEADICMSVGWVIKATKTVMKLAQTIGKDDDDVAQTVQIPVGMIIDVTELVKAASVNIMTVHTIVKGEHGLAKTK